MFIGLPLALTPRGPRVAAPPDFALLAEGNSIEQGGYDGLVSYIDQYPAAAATAPATFNNEAVSGSQWKGVWPVVALENRIAADIALLVPGKRNLLTVKLGTNDLFMFSLTPATIAARAVEMLDLLSAAGFITILETIPSLHGQETERAALNTLYRALVGTHCYAIVDFDTCAVGAVNACDDPLLFKADGIHPIAAGFTAMLAPYKAVVDAMATARITVLSPQLSVPGGSYGSTQHVVFTSPTQAATFSYTVDGSDPATSPSAVQASYADIGSSCTLKVRARKGGFNNSPIVSATYTITGTADAVLMETGFYELMETGDRILLEA